MLIYSLITSITIWKSIILIMKHYIQNMICCWLKWFKYNQKTFYMISMWNFQVTKMLKCIIYFLLHHVAFTICSLQRLNPLQPEVKKYNKFRADVATLQSPSLQKKFSVNCGIASLSHLLGPVKSSGLNTSFWGQCGAGVWT